ncbi:MAG: preprotein translocase subunit SecE [Candidatus Brockarchaeota archaeon]|nr:preprotein translocase subunit SecE [Candidatus Brockarchaeota archaeon]MBO3808550.1 preprotein translocase subunit SecE [Candidatus Brockarchaeota archaeon]
MSNTGGKEYIHASRFKPGMGLTDRVRTMVRVLKLSEKPDVSELKLSLKIFLIGILIVGGMAFVVHIVASLLQLTGVKLG